MFTKIPRRGCCMNLREIAKQAGVSLTTVSLVLNGKPGISSETRERVKDLLRQNGYDVEGKSKSNRSICFLKYLRHAHLVNGNPGFVTQIMDAVEQAVSYTHLTLPTNREV